MNCGAAASSASSASKGEAENCAYGFLCLEILNQFLVFLTFLISCFH